ncbi:DNA-binding protein [Escherichia coli]|uniref:DNA-binding protein n=1 Tax=Escherichia coli TaxID=562 RepID=UPI0010731A7E|nr:DNA-binding protein [Escherichia coli]MED8309031.1 DNA-binding protein [Escherichia coli]TFO04409.1 DNA-binding protein [Escherichia coli]GCU08337.1 SopA-central-domain-like hexapeptide repeat protein [Escherichia coli]HDS4257281.1 DNA-binding protein [Escherichia coli]HDX4117540.1 DNA-binding protein [Escherichia coli]
MSKISDLNYFQHITLADNFKQKSEVLNTWRVGMNNFARNAEGQDNTRNILDPKTFLEFLVKIFTLGYVDFSKRSNEAGRNMMAHIESSSYIKNNDGSELMKFVMNNPEGERADLSKVEIEITLSTITTMGTRQGHTAIIFQQPDGSTNRYEGKSFERKDESSLHLITNKILACYQREANKEIARLLNIPQELNNSHDLNNSQVSCKGSVDSTITDLLEKPLNNALLAIRKEHLLLMPYVCNESISYLLGKKGILKEIDDLNVLNNYLINNKKATDNEINDIKVNLSHILIDSLDDAKVNLAPVIVSILETFLKSPYINDVRILDWCFNKSMQYFDDSAKIKHACSVINHIDFIRDQSKDFSCDQSKIKIAETLFFNLDKEPYKNSRKLQELIWDKLVAYVNDFSLSNQEKSRLILRLFDDVKLLFNEVPVSILVNDIFLKDFFMKQPDFAKWYFYQLLKCYEGEQLYLNELGYVYGDEEKTKEIVNKLPGYVVKIFEEKMSNELKIRTRMMKILRNGKINIYGYINEEQLGKLNPPEYLRIAIKKLGWNN